MEQITVKELAAEFELKSTLVISELKKIGVWVPSATTQVDTDIANRIRKRLQLLVEADQEDKDRKTDRPRKAAASKARRSIKELGTARKRTAGKKAEEPVPESEAANLLAGPLKPRKGRKSTYQKMEALKEDHVPEITEITIEDEPVIEPAEVTAPKISLEISDVFPVEAAAAEMEEEAPAEIVEEAAAVTAEPVEEVAASEEAPVEEAVTEAAAVAEAEVPAEQEEPEAVATVEATAKPETKAAKPTEEELATEERPQRVKQSLVRRREKKERAKEKKAKTDASVPEKAEPTGPRELFFPERITVKTFAEETGLKSNEIIRTLMQQGLMVTMNQLLDQTTVEKLCEKFDIMPQFKTFEEVAAIQERSEERPEDLEVRAPVVTVMGHVDHGKTTLLDFIRHTQVAQGEAGGITQHIGAYDVYTNDRKIVFIDTPGHEAFTRMRARGAQATDIVVLVVAADDGVMPQTLEAIDHAHAANVPIIVAVNKIDKPGAQPDRVKQQLSDRGLVPENWGGDTIMVDVSAKVGTNVDSLLEMILLISEMQEMKSNPKVGASGVVLEAKMERGRGTVATLLVQNGTLRVGDNFIAGSAYGRIRAMNNDRGETVSEVGPSSAVEVLGLQAMPQAGDAFQVVDDPGKAKDMVAFRQEKQRELDLAKSARVSLDDLFAQLREGEVKELAVVLKGDTQGSVEVLEDTLAKLSTDKVRINVIHKNVGAITESDVLLASASDAIIIGFNVRPESNAMNLADKEEVELRFYSVIYDVAKDVVQAMLGLLEPTLQERYQGRAEVRDTFRIPKVGLIAGCYVQDGIITRNSQVRLLRDNVVTFEGRLASLKRFKDDVGEVKSGYECGIGIANFNDVKVGDVIEAFVREEVAPQLT